MFSAKSLKNAQLYNENFNHFFTEKLNTLTPEQRLSLPPELSFKLYKQKNEVSAERLSFNEKLYMLQITFGCDVVISVSDPENGLTKADFDNATKAEKGKLGNGEFLAGLKIKGLFVLGGKELMASLLYIANGYCSNIYKLIKAFVPNADHKKDQAFIADKKAFNSTLAFLANYEGNKRRIADSYRISMPEWYALVYFSAKEADAVDFYNKDFLYSYNSSRAHLFNAIKRMHLLGYLNKRKVDKKDRYSISAKGMNILDRIFNNILLNI